MDLPTRPSGVKWGLYIGLASIVFTSIIHGSGMNPGTGAGIGLGIVSMLTALGLFIMCVREYKKLNEGFLRLGQGVSLGLWSGLASGLLGGIFIFLYSSVIDPELPTKLLDLAKEQFANQPNGDEAFEMMAGFYKSIYSPVGQALSSLFGGVISGVIVGLIVGAIMKNERTEVI